MKDTVFVCGHKNPDLDSIAAAIGYANYKNIISNKTYIPIKINDINKETRFVLNYFNIEEPITIDTMKLKVSDLELSTIESLKPSVSIKEASLYLDKYEIDYISVVDERNKLFGILTKSSLNKIYTNVYSDNVLFESKTSLENIINTLEAKILTKGDNSYTGKIRIAAMSYNGIKDYINSGDIVIVGDRFDVISYSIEQNASLIIVTGGFEIDKELIKSAENNNVTIISTNYDSLTSARFLLLSIPISFVMAKENLITFNPDDLVSDVKKAMVQNRFRAYPVVDDSNYVYGMISRYNLLSKDRKQLILVDHNETSQSIDGVLDSEIVEIIDHHRVMDIKSNDPIYIRNEPVGSTSTIVAKIYFEHNIEMSREIAGLLMSGIISDTLLFKSPTCTEADIEICNKLALIAGINDIKEYAYEMQKVATSLDGVSASYIFNTDFKEFKIEKYKIGISQFNTIDETSFEKHRDEVLKYMNQRLESGNYDILLLALTNIINEGSLFICVGEMSIIEKSFDVKFTRNCVYVDAILSRKKQIVPIISKYLSF